MLRLKDLREDKDLTQQDIAKILNTTRNQVSKWENEIQEMGIYKLIKLTKFYNVSADYILGLTNEKKKLYK